MLKSTSFDAEGTQLRRRRQMDVELLGNLPLETTGKECEDIEIKTKKRMQKLNTVPPVFCFN
jgi:hypothetical protein